MGFNSAFKGLRATELFLMKESVLYGKVKLSLAYWINHKKALQLKVWPNNKVAYCV
jgi:hypothetical protein